MTSSTVQRANAKTPPTIETFATLQTLMARCFEHPDEKTAAAISSGQLGREILRRTENIGIDIDQQPTPETPREAYLRTFEAYEGEYAPPAESAYKEWWDGEERGILSGPSAHDMQYRYEQLDVEVPSAYPADHVALLLEYGSLLLEAGKIAEYLDFHATHFDWIESFGERIEQTGDVPFYEWAVWTLERVLDRTREHLTTTGNGVKPDE